MYKIGDKVVYPHHGAGTVVKREKREVLGEKREYLTIKILHNDMTVNVPSENAEAVGLRKVIGEDMAKVVYGTQAIVIAEGPRAMMQGVADLSMSFCGGAAICVCPSA